MDWLNDSFSNTTKNLTFVFLNFSLKTFRISIFLYKNRTWEGKKGNRWDGCWAWNVSQVKQRRIAELTHENKCKLQNSQITIKTSHKHEKKASFPFWIELIESQEEDAFLFSTLTHSLTLDDDRRTTTAHTYTWHFKRTAIVFIVKWKHIAKCSRAYYF